MELDMSDLGQFQKTEGRGTLVFRRRLAHSPVKVWRALTESEHLNAWFPCSIEGERTAGSALQFSFLEMPDLKLEGEVLTWDPPRRFEFKWGPDTLRFDVEPDGEGCVFTLTDVFDEIGKGARDAAGWHVCLENLDDALDGQEPAPERKAASYWRTLNARYQALFGPEASTDGPPQEWEESHGSVE
jgi:uncharacterized protein YndB with AHSA1/START domain